MGPCAHNEGADRCRRPFRTVQSKRVGLHLFLFAHVGRSIPRATSLRAIGLGLGGCHISREGWTCEGKCEGQCKNRKKSFHGVYSLTPDLKSGRKTAFEGLRFQEHQNPSRVESVSAGPGWRLLPEFHHDCRKSGDPAVPLRGRVSS